MRFYSQFSEDSWVYNNLKLPNHGSFIDVGSWDGVESSNTKFFEDELGWEGICIEPVRSAYEKCLANRKKTTRCIHAVAGKDFAFSEFYVNEKEPGLSGMKPNPGCVVKKMNVVPIWAYYKDFPDLTLLSIDTEGTELDVWAGRGKLTPRIVIIEALTILSPPRWDEVVAQFTQDGYSELHRTTANLIFQRT